MKEIINSNTRQVQPVDFSFLSGADQDIVAGIELMLRTIYGWNGSPKQPIVLNGLIYNTTTKIISAGIILYDGRIYNVDSKLLLTSVLISTTVTATAATLEELVGDRITANILDSVKLQLKQEVVSPSPVLDKNLAKTINCHVNNKADIIQLNIEAENIFNYTSLNRITLLATNANLEDLINRVTTLESKVTLLQGTTVS